MRQDGSTVDRRQNKLKTVLWSLFMKRRIVPLENHYVDVHESKVVLVIVSVLVLCSADAYMTLLIINQGGSELNPLMDVLMKKDVALFFFTKYFMTSAGVLFFLVHKNFKFFRHFTGYHFLFSCLFIYATLIIYELYLIYGIPNGLFL